MAIDVGDAIMRFLGDTTQLDETFVRVGGEAPAKLAPANAALGSVTQSTKQLSQELDATGENVAFAGSEIANAMERSSHSVREAKGEAALLGEAFGIHLPRHVRSFMAELPGVGTALSAAFAATAVLFIIEAVVQAIEKITELVHAQKEIDEMWGKVHDSEKRTFESLEDNLLKAQARVAELTGNHLEALRLKLQLIDNSTLGKLRDEFAKLEAEADKAFDKMNRSWFSKIFLGLEGSEDAKKKFDETAKAVDAALDERTPEAFAKAMKLVDDATTSANTKLKELIDQQKENQEITRRNALSGGRMGAVQPVEPVDSRTIQSYQELGKSLQSYRHDLEEAQKADQEEKKASNLDERKKQITDLEQAEKRHLDLRLAQIEAEKQANFALFNQGKLDAEQWAHAQSKAVNEAAQAQIDYKERLLAIEKTGPDANKAVAASQELATTKLKEWNSAAKSANEGLQKAQQETAKLRAEMEKIVFPVEKAKDQSKVFEELTQAEHRLAEAEKNLHLAEQSQEFKQQEAAIRQLANLRIVSKEQEAAMLANLNRKEEADAIASVRELLASQEAELNQAKAKFQAAEKDGFFPPDELAQLKRNLDEAQIAWDKTQTDILRRQSATDSQLLKLDRSYFGESLALAVSAGNKELAEQLKLKKAQLDTAAARKEDTKAIQAQIKALEKQAHQFAATGSQLQRFLNELKQGGNLEKLFERDLLSGSKGMQNFGASAQFVSEEFGSAWQSAFSQWILGEASLGQAMAKGTAEVLAQIAARAMVYGLFYTAQGIADTFWNPARAGADFTAAGEFFAIGAVAGAAAAGINAAAGGGGSVASSATGSAGPSAGSPNVTGQSAPTPVVNVAHLASGGLVTRPTLAIVGDAHGGGSATEAVIPLQDRAAMKALIGAITQHSGNQQVEIVLHSDIPAVARHLSRGVNSGKIRLLASNSIRVTRRS